LTAVASGEEGVIDVAAVSLPVVDDDAIGAAAVL
jgi:hypothetical protein